MLFNITCKLYCIFFRFCQACDISSGAEAPNLLDQDHVRYDWAGGCSDWVKRDSKALNDAKKDNDFSKQLVAEQL